MPSVIIFIISFSLLITAFMLSKHKQKADTAEKQVKNQKQKDKNQNIIDDIYASVGYKYVKTTEYNIPVSSTSYINYGIFKKKINPQADSKIYIVVTKSGIDIICVIHVKRFIQQLSAKNNRKYWVFHDQNYNRFELTNPYQYVKEHTISYIKDLAQHSPIIKENINTYIILFNSNEINFTNNIVYGSTYSVRKQVNERYRENLSDAHIRKITQLLE